MNFIKSFINKQNEIKQKRNEECDNLILEVEQAISEIETYFNNKNEFIHPLKAKEWIDKNQALRNKLKHIEIKKIKKAVHYDSLEKSKKKFECILDNLENDLNAHNDLVAKNKVEEAYEIIGDVEGRRLDEQQMTCIVKDVDNHLVLAGAGTGKTTTIVGKIKYLLMHEQVDYKDILVLSFTNASASEMNERIKKETGYAVDAMTFHKLGLNIIKNVDGKVPTVSNLDKRKFIKKELEENIKNEKYLNKLNNYFLFARVKAKNEFEFESMYEYKNYLKTNPPTTLKREEVKSYGEMQIANFLFMNDIKYEYEKKYFIDTSDENHAQYHPDFYLPDYNIYIEYFGIDRNYKVPTYFKDNGEYVQGIEWKRNLHKEHNTTLIECYAYENFEETLLENLKIKLEKESVVFNPLSQMEIFELLKKENNGILVGLITLFGTLINLIKSNNYNFDYVRMLNEHSSFVDKKINVILLDLLEPVFNSYNQLLTNDRTIDFNDMINKAAQYINEGKYTHNYKYVIVDEYQDISKARFNLLYSLRKSNPYHLFCVGDDWQSIYCFSGSDIDYTTNFSKYWGFSQTSRIETTYRFNSSLINISGSFIMENPNQKRKILKSKLYGNDFALGIINGYTDSLIIDRLTERLNYLPKNSSIYFLGRYRHDVHIFENNPIFKFNYDDVSGVVKVIYLMRRDLDIRYLTAHSSKGLQADYVFILNNADSIMGFPSRIEDSSLVELLLEGSDDFPFAEERRLFYVALTRAKVKAYLLVRDGKESVFVQELLNKYNDELKRELFTCPLCGGRLRKIEGKNGPFLGCTNYKDLGCRYTRNLK